MPAGSGSPLRFVSRAEGRRRGMLPRGRKGGWVYRDSPVQQHGLDLALELVELDVVPHKREHLHLVCDEQRSVALSQITATGDGKANKSTARAKFESTTSRFWSAKLPRRRPCARREGKGGNAHPLTGQAPRMIPQHVSRKRHAGRPELTTTSILQIFMEKERLSGSQQAVEVCLCRPGGFVCG